MPLPVPRNPRELRNLLESKRIKREPSVFTAKGAARAVARADGGTKFAHLRNELRSNVHFSRAVKHLDELQSMLWRRHQAHVPKPKGLTQNEDSSISVFWEGLSLRAFPDAVVTLIQRRPAKGITNDFLDALAFLAKVQ